MSLAAEHTGIGRNTVYLRRKVDPSFALGWRNAVEMAAEGGPVESIETLVARRELSADYSGSTWTIVDHNLLAQQLPNFSRCDTSPRIV